MDFTQKSREEIQEYLSRHTEGSVCGRFQREQMDAITIEIPRSTFSKPLSFQKRFILALLLTMGTTLFSCESSQGKKQQIENVVLIDVQDAYNKSIDTISQEQCEQILEKMIYSDELLHPDSIPDNYSYVGGIRTLHEKLPPLFDVNFDLDRIEEIEESEDIVEDVPYYSGKEIRFLDSLASIHPSKLPPPPPITGVLFSPNELVPKPNPQSLPVDTIPEVEEIEDEEFFLGEIAEESPRFQEAKSQSRFEAKKDFHLRMTRFFADHFKIPKKSLGLNSGTYLVEVQLDINEKGVVSIVAVKTAYAVFEKEVKRVVKMLPKLIPATQRGNPIRSKFTLPLRIEIK